MQMSDVLGGPPFQSMYENRERNLMKHNVCKVPWHEGSKMEPGTFAAVLLCLVSNPPLLREAKHLFDIQKKLFS